MLCQVLEFSEHFSYKEMTVTRTGLKNVPTGKSEINLCLLSHFLESFRSYLKRPIVVNSAFRSKAVNKKVHGAAFSWHCVGSAADIRVHGMSPSELRHALQTFCEGDGKPKYRELLQYGTFVHIAFHPDQLYQHYKTHIYLPY